jgi:hypothetical protein
VTAAGDRLPVGLAERFERVNGRPLVAACPPSCSCRGVPEGERLDLPRQHDEQPLEPAMAGR